MDKPRLKIRDKEVGLRDLGDNLFEPKNITLLADVIANKCNTDHNPKFWLEKGVLSRNLKHIIKYKAFVLLSQITSKMKLKFY